MYRFSFSRRLVINILNVSLLTLIFLLAGCKKGNLELEVKIETLSAGEVGPTSCIVQGKVIDLGNYVFTQHGFCYSDSENPTIHNEATQLGERTSIGTFSDTLVNLVCNTKYYFRAYAQTKDEIYYDDQKSFTTSAPSTPELSTTSISMITIDAAQSGGNVISDGGASVSARGVCWNTSQGPTISGSHTTDGAGIGNYTSAMSGLSCGTTYYVRAYATNSAGTKYGEELSFTTSDCLEELPVVSTTSVSSITMTTAQIAGNVTSDGGATVTAKGVCWSTSQDPTVLGSHTAGGAGIGEFSIAISGLSCGTSYFVRAYATNSVGTIYGEQLSFNTSDCPEEILVVTTTTVSSITETTAKSGGNVISDGGSSVTAKGVCWSTSTSPTTSNAHTNDGGGMGVFTSNLTGLTPNTSYYVRAYATNSEGTSYGELRNFTTDVSLSKPTVNTNAVSSITQTTAISGGNVLSDGNAPVTSRGICWSTSTSPTTSDAHTNNGSGTGNFTSNLTGLNSNTTYYVRAYATNSQGTSYGELRNFITPQVVSPPTVSTNSISSVTKTSAQSGGNVTNDGGAPVTARGLCWSTSTSPTIYDNYINDGTGTGAYSITISGLSCGTSYYVRAYATNSAGTNYGEQIGFSTEDCMSVTDVDGNIYQIVTIGDQVWMAENLKTTRYANGSAIPLVEGISQWDNLTGTDKAYCFYDNSSSNKDTYGVLYTWAAAMNGSGSSGTNPSGVQGVCPSGWHLPSESEYKALEISIGGSDTGGGKLKNAGYTFWSYPNTGATNETGFNALPAGYRDIDGAFSEKGLTTYLWTSQDNNEIYGWFRPLYYNGQAFNSYNWHKQNGFSVRCVKNE